MSQKIYIIEDTLHKIYKIGISNNPNKRLKQLQTGSHSKLEIYKTYEVNNARLIETSLHNGFKLKCNKNDQGDDLMGEWFYLSLEDLSSLDEQIPLLDDVFNNIN